jgi:hypothetical protein
MEKEKLNKNFDKLKSRNKKHWLENFAVREQNKKLVIK